MKFIIRDIKLFLLLFPFFKPEYLTMFNVISWIFDIWKIVSVVICIILLLKYRIKSASKQLLVIELFAAFLLFSTVLSSGDLFGIIKFVATILAFSVIFEIYQYKPQSLISVILFCFELFIYVNFITILVFPHGIYITGTVYTGFATQNWLLGFKNTQVVFFLPALLFSKIQYCYTGKKARHYILNIVVMISTVLIQSTTTIIALAVYFLLTLLLNKDAVYNVFSVRNILIATVVAFSLMVVLQKMNFVLSVASLFSKDTTLAYRTRLWLITLKSFLENPIIGHGWQSEATRRAMYVYGGSFVHAHNTILEELYIGGIVFIAFKVLMYGVYAKKIKKIPKNKIIISITSAFAAIQIIGISEFYLNPLIYCVVIVMMYVDYFIEV